MQNYLINTEILNRIFNILLNFIYCFTNKTFFQFFKAQVEVPRISLQKIINDYSSTPGTQKTETGLNVSLFFYL